MVKQKLHTVYAAVDKRKLKLYAVNSNIGYITLNSSPIMSKSVKIDITLAEEKVMFFLRQKFSNESKIHKISQLFQSNS